MDDVDTSLAVPLILRRDLLAQGWTDRAILRRLSSGEWHKIRNGAYCEAARWASLGAAGRHLLRSRAVREQSKTDVVLSHTSSLALWGAPLWRVSLDHVDVTRVDARSGRCGAGVRQHRGQLLRADVVTRRGLLTTNPTRAALEATTCAPLDAALAVVNYLLHERLTTPDLLRTRYLGGPWPIDSWRDTRSTDLVLRLARREIESVGETRTFLMLWRNQLPAPVLQHEVRDHNGDVLGYLDFAWPDLGVWIEFDELVKYRQPFKSHQDAAQVVIDEKLREDRIARATGWRCIRLTWRDLETPEATVALIRAALAAGRRAA